MQRSGNACAKRAEKKEKKITRRRNTLRAVRVCVYPPSAITNNERTSDASLSSFFIKFHHGCPILIVFICWEMFVNVISFNFGGTFLLRDETGRDRRPSSVRHVRGGEIQNIYYALCVCSALSHSYLKSIHFAVASCWWCFVFVWSPMSLSATHYMHSGSMQQ